MTGGTSRVATMMMKTRFLPRNCMRASGYAASDAVMTTSVALRAAATMLFANHCNTGVAVPGARIDANACSETGLGIHDGGTAVASALVLRLVTIMKIIGLMNAIAIAPSTTTRAIVLLRPRVRRARDPTLGLGVGVVVRVLTSAPPS